MRIREFKGKMISFLTVVIVVLIIFNVYPVFGSTTNSSNSPEPYSLSPVMTNSSILMIRQTALSLHYEFVYGNAIQILKNKLEPDRANGFILQFYRQESPMPLDRG